MCQKYITVHSLMNAEPKNDTRGLFIEMEAPDRYGTGQSIDPQWLYLLQHIISSSFQLTNTYSYHTQSFKALRKIPTE